VGERGWKRKIGRKTRTLIEPGKRRREKVRIPPWCSVGGEVGFCGGL